MKSPLGYVLIGLLIASCIYSQSISLQEIFPDIKGNPLYISASIASTSSSFGDIKINEKEISNQYIFTINGKLLERVEYENGNPIKYFHYYYDGSKRLTKITIKSAEEVITSNLTYGPKKGDYTILTKDSGGKIISKSEMKSMKVGPNTLYITKEYDSDNKIINYSRTLKDENGKKLKDIEYDSEGKIRFLTINTYSKKERITKIFSSDGKLFLAMRDKFDEKGNSIESETSYSESGNKKYTTEYKYDTGGNWIELIEYEILSGFDGLISEPTHVAYREIKYPKSGQITSQSIEPKELFSKSKLENASLESINNPPTGSPRMKVYESTDPFDDLKVITFSVRAENARSKYGDSILFYIRAKENNTPEVFIDWNAYLGTENLVTMRIDSNPSEEFSWIISTDSMASFYPRDVNELLSEVINAKKIWAKTTPYGESPISAEFYVGDFKNLVKPYPWIISVGSEDVEE